MHIPAGTVICNTQLFISPMINNLSPHTAGKKGEMTSLLSESHTLAANGYTVI